MFSACEVFFWVFNVCVVRYRYGVFYPYIDNCLSSAPSTLFPVRVRIPLSLCFACCGTLFFFHNFSCSLSDLPLSLSLFLHQSHCSSLVSRLFFDHLFFVVFKCDSQIRLQMHAQVRYREQCEYDFVSVSDLKLK